MSKAEKTKLVVLVGSSGSGKSTYAKGILDKHPDLFYIPKRHQTRKRRAEDPDSYVQIENLETFLTKDPETELVSFTLFDGNIYATEVFKTSPKVAILEATAAAALGMVMSPISEEFNIIFEVILPTVAASREGRSEGVISLEQKFNTEFVEMLSGVLPARISYKVITGRYPDGVDISQLADICGTST